MSKAISSAMWFPPFYNLYFISVFTVATRHILLTSLLWVRINKDEKSISWRLSSSDAHILGKVHQSYSYSQSPIYGDKTSALIFLDKSLSNSIHLHNALGTNGWDGGKNGIRCHKSIARPPLHSFSISYCSQFFTLIYSVVSLRIWIPLFGSYTRTQLPFNGFVTAVSLKNPKRSADDMNELAVCMSCDEKSVLTLCSLHRRFVSRLICFLRGDLSLLKYLADLIAQHIGIPPLFPSRDGLVLAFGEQELRIASVM